MTAVLIMEHGWCEDTHLHEMAEGYQVQRSPLVGVFRHRREQSVVGRGLGTITTFGAWRAGLPTCSRRPAAPAIA